MRFPLEAAGGGAVSGGGFRGFWVQPTKLASASDEMASAFGMLRVVFENMAFSLEIPHSRHGTPQGGMPARRLQPPHQDWLRPAKRPISATMLTYKDLTTQARRALDRFARAQELEAPASYWPEIGPAALTTLVNAGLLEARGRNARNEELYRLTDDGTRVHDEMWRDGKVPSHPRTDPFDPSTLD